MLIESFSGIRGVYGKDLDETTAKKYAAAFLNSIKKENPKIVIGTDSRPSNNKLKQAMISVLDAEIIDVGINTTPAVELAVREYKADAGIIITASHNEPEYNGFKFLDNTGALIEPAQAEEVINNFHKNPEIKEIQNKTIINNTDDLIERYTDFVLSTIDEKAMQEIKDSNLKIIIDPNGGSAIVVIKNILEKLNINIIEKNTELGKFNRIIEPTEETLYYLTPLIEQNNADFAAGFDCDADRVELIDNKGNMISGQYVLALLVDEILSQSPPTTVVTNDATSGVIKELAEKYNSKVEEVECGEINVVKRMYETNSLVGGEGSNGGVIIPPSRCRDGIQTTALILQVIARKNKKLSQLIDELPRYYTPRINIKHNKDTLEIRKKLEEEFKDYKQQTTGDEIGGLKIIFDEKSWLWFRGSRTEPNILRMIADSNSKEKADKIYEKGIKAVEKITK